MPRPRVARQPDRHNSIHAGLNTFNQSADLTALAHPNRMKFPTARSPFGELSPLHPEHAQRLSNMAAALVDQAIDEYDQFVRVQKRRLARSDWKPVKKVENLTLYRQRRSRPADSDANRLSCSAITSSASAPFEVESDQHINWSLPKVVTVGTLAGSLEDVMLGVSSPDAAAMLRKAAYNMEEMVDADVLYSIEKPTEDAPFSFVGVKWMVLELHAMSRRRDIVYLESTGVRKLPDGRRIGFVLTHSLDDELEGCKSLEQSHNILRSRISSCYLFSSTDDKNQTVDVYMKGFVQPSGKMVDSFAISTSATAILQFFAHAVECAQHRKLAHKVETNAGAKPEDEQQLVLAEQSTRTRSTTSTWIQRRIHGDMGKAKCSVCRSAGGLSPLKLFRSTSGNSTLNQRPAVGACELCKRHVCGKCRMTRKLWLAAPATSASKPRSKHLRESTVVVCTACVVDSNHQSAEAVARADVQAMTANGSSCGGLESVLRPLATTDVVASPTSPSSSPRGWSPTLSSVRTTKSNPSRTRSPISEWHRQYASLRSSTPAAIPGFPTREEVAAMEAEKRSDCSEAGDEPSELESVVDITVRLPAAGGSSDSTVETTISPVSSSILIVEQPEDAVKKVVAVSVSDRRARGKSQPLSECDSTDRESSIDGEEEGTLNDAVVVFSERSTGSTTSCSSVPDSPSISTTADSNVYSQPGSQTDLWARITELRRNAEDVYQMTLRTTVSMTGSCHGASSTPLASSIRPTSLIDDLD